MSKKAQEKSVDVSALLARKMMQCKVSISQWNGKIKDTRIAREYEAENEMDEGTFDAIRHLMKEKVEPLIKRAGKIRNYVYKITKSPDLLLGISENTSQNSWRCIPTKTLLVERKIVDQMIQALKQAWNEFLNEYESLIEQDIRAQGKRGNAADYPSLDEMAGKFKIKFRVQPMPVARDFAEGIIDKELQQIFDDSKQQDKEIVEGMIRQAWADIKVPLQGLVAALDGTKKFYKEATLKQIVTTITLMRGFNITDDRDIEKCLCAMEDKLTGWTAKDLKKDPAAEAQMLGDAKEILNDFSAFF
jgi:hypothetical protein